MKRYVMLAIVVMAFATPVASLAQTQAPPKQAAQDEFVPVSAPLNPQDTMPAPRLVAIAYGFIWVVLFGYVWSVQSRLSRVEREMAAVSRRVPERK
jgi:CcmD family protein